MLKNLKHYYRPDNIKEALELINDPEEKNLIIGGGSFLAFSNDISVDGLVDISKLNIDKIDITDEFITIGAKTTIRQIQKSEALRKILDGAINETASMYMSALHRNQSTIGGIINTAFPHSELIALLICLDASLTYEDSEGKQNIAFKDLYRSNPQNTLRFAVIKSIQIPKKEVRVYIQRLARTKTDIAIISVILVEFAGSSRAMAFSSVDHLPKWFAFEKGINPTKLMDRIEKELKVISDIRASSEYRKEMALVFAKRLLNKEKYK